jgi:zinc protease
MEAIAWYQKWYAPNNAVLMILGDVDPKKTFDLAEKHFGHLEKKNLPKQPELTALTPMGERQLNLVTHSQTPFVIYGVNVPTVASAKTAWEPYAIRVLTAVLSEGQSAKLDQKLVHQSHLATNVGIYYPMYQKYDSTLSIHLSPQPNIPILDAISGIRDIIETLKTEPITKEELSRAQAQIIAEDTYDRDLFSSEAIALGQRAIMGIPIQEKEDFAKHIIGVTSAQVMAVAKRYFTEANCTIVYTTPKGAA